MNQIKTETLNEYNFNELLKKTDEMTSKIVACHGCTKCCENGVVYVLPEEKEKLKKIGVPLIEIDGITIIERKQDRSCPMLDKKNKKCTIYEERPFCCRAFPLDVFSRNGKLEWGSYTYCPEDRIKPLVNRNGKLELDIDVIETIINKFERNLTPDIITFLSSEDKVCAKIEVLDNVRDEYKIIGPIL